MFASDIRQLISGEPQGSLQGVTGGFPGEAFGESAWGVSGESVFCAFVNLLCFVISSESLVLLRHPQNRSFSKTIKVCSFVIRVQNPEPSVFLNPRKSDLWHLFPP